VVLPVYNQAYLLDESIRSVLGQTYQEFELIVINDGSTDGVEAVLEKYLDHPKVRCFSQANQRLPKALSNGFSFARGEFWTWTSADNIMEPTMLERLVGKLRAEPDVGLVYADYYAIDDRGALLQDPTWRAHNRPDPHSGEIRLPHTTEQLNVVQDNFIGPCFMYRGWIGRCMGDYDPQLGIEDYDYWMRINAFFPVRHLGAPDLLYRYRVHDNTLSAQANEHRIFDKVRRLMEYEKERSGFFRTRMSIVADATGRQWLSSAGMADADLSALADATGALLTESVARADLVLVGSESAATFLSELSLTKAPTAVLFRADDHSHQKLQRLLNRSGCMALASSQVVADRIRLVAHCPVLDMLSAWAPVAVRAFARNHIYFHRTRTEQELQRQAPRQLLDLSGQHVLLQVDSFMQGGMEHVVIDLGVSLSEAGCRVTIANLGGAGDAVAKARDRGLRVESIAGGTSPSAYIDWVRKEGITLVNGHYSIFAAAECRSAGIAFVETIHNSYVWLDQEKIRQYREADPHISAYVCVSNTAALYADVVIGLDVSKMQVIPNGIDSRNVDATHFEGNRRLLREQWKLTADAPVFLNVASMMATKAQLPLVKAFARVLKKRPDARLVLLGSVLEPSYRDTVEKAIRDLRLQQCVILAGYEREVARYYHAADVFVLPSFWEGWSLSLGEAMANGLPCVITDVGSAYEFEGHPRVEVVPPPFGEITSLNSDNLSRYVYGEDESFIDSLAQAMERSMRHARGPVDVALAHRLDRQGAYRKHAEAFVPLLRR
ncbi:MAG: glycosyltransferase, partial [Burkholderiales bacterium]